MNEKGETNYLTIKDPEKVILRDNLNSLAIQSLELKFQKCQNETSSVICASEDEIEKKIQSLTLVLGSLTNFVAYDEVEPGVGPIKRIARTVEVV